MKTKLVSPGGKEVTIGDNFPTVLIGERLHPYGKGPIKEALLSGAMEPIREEALKQAEAGADVLNVSVNGFGIDESAVLPRAISEIVKAVDVPLCLESRNPVALEGTLRLGCGRPMISSVTGEDHILDEVLPLARRYNTVVVMVASDAAGIPKNPQKRLQLIKQLIDRTDRMNIPREDIVVDCIAESSAVNGQAAIVTLETMRLVKSEFGVNLILGASNASFGLPNRAAINSVFLGLAIQAGLTCAIVDAAKMKSYAMAADLLLGRDPLARRYTSYHRKLKRAYPH